MTNTNEFEVTFSFTVKYDTGDFPDCSTVYDCMAEIHERIHGTVEADGTWGSTISAALGEFTNRVGYTCGFSATLADWHRDAKTAYAFHSGNLGQAGELHLRGTWWPDVEEDEEGLHPFVVESCEGDDFTSELFLVRKHQVHN